MTYLEERATGKGRLPDREAAEAFYQQFKSGNDACARQWLGRDTLFQEDFSHYPAVATEGSREKALALLGDYFSRESDAILSGDDGVSSTVKPG